MGRLGIGPGVRGVDGEARDWSHIHQFGHTSQATLGILYSASKGKQIFNFSSLKFKVLIL